MPIHESAVLHKTRLFAEAHLGIQQFGQVDDEYPWNGKTACTHACWQFIIWLWKGRHYTLDQISRLAGYPYQPKRNGVMRGMDLYESNRLVSRLSLPYILKLDRDWATIQDYQPRGPILYGCRHGHIPEWRGYTYKGVRADGKPNGFARWHGKTQLFGYENGRHAVVGLGRRRIVDSAGRLVRVEFLRKDPNHHSSSRPERPAYDIITVAQGHAEYDAYQRLGPRFAYVPTKTLPH